MNLKSILLVSALGIVGAANAAGIAGNSIAVYSIGSGAAALSSAAQATNVLTFSTAGTATGTFAVPASGATSLTNGGTATSEGELALSADGKNLLFAGYRADAGTTGIAATTSTANPRVIGSLSVGTGAINTATTTTAFSASNPRGAYSFDSLTYYAVGGNSGVVSGTLGSTTGATVGTPTVTNLRTIGGFGGNLYFSTGSGTRGIYQVDPTTGVQTNILATGATSSPYGFQFLSATSLLVADDTTATGGLSLYTNTGSGFTLASTLLVPTRSFAVNGSTIYFASADGTSLNSVSLTGTTFGSVTTLATAATNTVFRGVAFVPQAVPEPSAFAALGLGIVAIARRRRSAK